MDPFIGEIRLFAGTYPPEGWSFCDGSLIAINDNEALYSLIGNVYGGDGANTFGLPDLRGRVPVHVGNGAGTTTVLGQQGGVETVTLTSAQTAAHTHSASASSATASSAAPSASVTLAKSSNAAILPYGTDAPLTNLAAASISSSGQAAPHNNLQPYLAINYIIAVVGLYPSSQ